MSWIQLDYLMKRIRDRKFTWTANTRLKYLHIRIDARDDYATLSDRDGRLVASTKEELDELFDALNAKAEANEWFKVRGKRFGNPHPEMSRTTKTIPKP